MSSQRIVLGPSPGRLIVLTVMKYAVLKKVAPPRMLKEKKAVDWASPQTLVVTILAILLGIGLLYAVWKLRCTIMP